jgi:hypothetical protein
MDSREHRLSHSLAYVSMSVPMQTDSVVSRQKTMLLRLLVIMEESNWCEYLLCSVDNDDTYCIAQCRRSIIKKRHFVFHNHTRSIIHIVLACFDRCHDLIVIYFIDAITTIIVSNWKPLLFNRRDTSVACLFSSTTDNAHRCSILSIEWSSSQNDGRKQRE